MAEQIAAKARLPLVNPFSSDKTVNQAGVPWVLSCTPGDDLIAPVLADEISARIGEKPFVFVSTDGHDARLFSEELVGSLSRLHLAPRLRFEYKPQATDMAGLASRICQLGAGAVMLAAGAADSARLVKGLRAAGYKGSLFGGPWMGRRQFLHDAGAAGEGCIFPLLFAAGRQSEYFLTAFSRRAGAPPDYAAAHTYDAVQQVVAAIRKAGLNRARTYDALRSLSPWEGVTGATAWENQGAATQDVGIATISEGKVIRAK